MLKLDDFDFLVIALFQAPLHQLRLAIASVFAKDLQAGLFEATEGSLRISSVYERQPPPGGAHKKRAVCFEPASARGTTALIANLQDGWLTLCNVLASRIPGEHALARSSIDVPYPVTDLEVWDHGASARYVRAFREDPSWEFFSRGKPRAFEDLENYKKRRIKDRFNRSILITYLARLGWDLTAAEFWRSQAPAYYLREKGPKPRRRLRSI